MVSAHYTELWIRTIAESGFVLSQKSAQAAPDVKLWRNKIGSGQELYHNRIRILFELKKT